MRLKGNFLLREVMGEMIAIPVGEALLDFNGMVCLNPVGCVIWSGLQSEKTKEEILADILEKFDVTREEALADVDEFLLRLKESDLLEM